MAKQTISQRFALEGSEEIKAVLAALGKAGERAFGAIQQAAEKANPAIAGRLTSAVATFRTNLAQLELAAGRFQGALGNLGNAVSRFGSSIGTVAARLSLLGGAALGAIAAFVGLGKAATETVDASDRAAQSVGLTIEKYSGLQAAASQSSISQDEFNSSMTRLNATLGKTTDGLGLSAEEITKNQAALKKLGIATSQYNGEAGRTEDVLFQIADKFASLPDGVEKSALAIELFGKSGARMIPFLNGGREGIKALIADAKAMGLVFSEADKKTAALADQGLDRLGQAILGARTQLGLLFAPAIAAGANFFANLIRDNLETIKEFGRVVRDEGITVVADFIAIILGADDRVENRWLLTIRDGVVEFGRVVKSIALDIVVPAFRLIRDTAQLVADGVNDLFGTQLTGTQVLVIAAALKLSGALRLIGDALGIVTGSVNLLLAGWRLLAPLAGVLWSGLVLLGEGLAVVATGLATLLGLPVAVVVAIAAAIAAAGVAIYVYWDEIKAAAGVAWDAVVAGAEFAFETIAALFDPATWVTLWEGLSSAAGVAWEAVKAAAADAWTSIKSGAEAAWAAVYDAAKAALDQIATFLSSTLGIDWTVLEKAAADAWARIKATAQTAWEGIKSVITSARDAIVNAFANPGALFSEIFDAWRSVWEDLFGAISGFAVDMASTLKSVVGGAISYLVGQVRSLIAAVSGVQQPAGEGNPIGNGFAGGGHIRGPGGPTADRIPIWASDGEFMVRARAVKRLGLRFLYMLNSGRYSLEDLMRRFGAVQGFKAGGLIGAPRLAMPLNLDMGAFGMAPRFAEGGFIETPATSSDRFTLELAGETFPGLTGPADVIQKLERFARGKAIRSAGRMPR